MVAEASLGISTATSQNCPHVHVLRDSQIVLSLVGSETLDEHMLVEEQTLLFATNPSEAGGCNPALQADRIVERLLRRLILTEVESLHSHKQASARKPSLLLAFRLLPTVRPTSLQG